MRFASVPSRQELQSLHFIGAACIALSSIVFAACTRAEPELAEPASEFELIVLGTKHYPNAKFSLGYGLAHGFSRIDLNGSSYRQASPGVVFRTVEAGPPLRYVVIVDQQQAEWLPEFARSILKPGVVRLVDRGTNTVLGEFSLGGDGWVGDKAGAWLASLLRPNRNVLVQMPDVSASAIVEAVSPTALLDPAELKELHQEPSGCADDVSISTTRSEVGSLELQTPSWSLLLPYGTREVHCSLGSMIVFGGHRQEDLEVLAITADGKLDGRGFIRNAKGSLGSRYHHTKIVKLENTGDSLSIQQAHFSPNSPQTKPESATQEFTFSVPWSALRVPR